MKNVSSPNLGLVCNANFYLHNFRYFSLFRVSTYFTYQSLYRFLYLNPPVSKVFNSKLSNSD